MRKIEFRAWLKDEKRIVEVPEIDFAYKMIKFRFTETGKDERRMFDQIELMQYTGLTDKNGKKIFEGDIVVDNDYAIYEVFYDEELACFRLKNTSDIHLFDLEDSIEIIGNIHENKELLEDE